MVYYFTISTASFYTDLAKIDTIYNVLYGILMTYSHASLQHPSAYTISILCFWISNP